MRRLFEVRLHLYAHEAPADVIRHSGGYVAHFHANDASRRGPGFGDTDFAPIADALADIGYDGYVSVEVFDFADEPEAIARNSLRYLRDVFEGVW